MEDLPVFGSGLPELEQDFSWLLSMPQQLQPSPTAPAPLPPFVSTSTSPPDSLSPPTEPPAKRQKSCQACRLRRVKCERPPGSNDCTACISRGFSCLPMPARPPKKAAATRDGKRIVQARALFGGAPKDDAASNSVDLALLELQSASSTSHSPPMEASYIFPSSYASRINTMEVQGAVAGSLMDLYLTTQPTIALIEDTNFRVTFEAAGRRLGQLDDQAQVLCAAVLAIGARVSDHPLLVGRGAPRLIELSSSAKAGVNLTEFGQRREATCRALAETAVKLVDEKATLRVASIESIAALMLVEGLLDSDDASLQASRPYVQAMNGHARALLALPGTTPEARSRLSGSVLGWTAYVRDALWAANTGTAPSFSDDDLYQLREHGDRDVSLEKALALPPLADPIVSFWTLLIPFMHHVTNLARDTSSKLTGVRARAAERIDEDFAADFLARVDVGVNAVPEVVRRSKFFVNLPKGRAGQDVGTIVRSLRVTLYNLMFLLDRVVSQRVGARFNEPPRATITELAPWPTIPGPASDEAYWARLLQLKTRAAQSALRGARGVAQVIGEAVESGVPIGTHECLDIRGTLLLFSRLPIWAARILEAPVAEEGGSLDFTFDVKLSELRMTLKALYSIAWAHYKLSVSTIPWIQSEIVKLEAKQAHHLLAAAAFVSTTQGLDSQPSFSPFDNDVLSNTSIPTTPWSDEELNAILNTLEHDLGDASALAMIPSTLDQYN
ncbi:hypothetical protein BCR35DRAFT_298608 [Leucosporidium creatinivorum]|uniref:Zn(2)-C6 fungal-type domain-containing protein n=1 Tax=Leucosporidium creatinivorum TaxID=106004 RepID=A0A1Y2G264_9BASI|nr:hypothetical protein BCR35DRAFT_298608 [Leucosporidium creatinivorum]